MIEVKSLSKSFNALKAVNNVSFSIPKGEIVGLLGPNGAGKTTTMRMMTGFLNADDGDVVIGGSSVKQDPIEVKSKIGYLPENAPLYDDMIVEDYLNFMGQARGLGEDELKGAVDKMVEACSLKTHLRKNISQLSKGYKQRVGLASTMIHNPDVLILDEPTTGLDPNQIIEIRNLILEIGKEKTVILSTHIMQEVQETCNRVLIIDKGNLIEDDSVDALVAATDAQVEMTCMLKNATDAVSVLDSQPFVLRAEAIQAGDGTGVKLFSERHIGEEIFNLAKERGWVLTEMTTVKKNLESVFRSLTGQAGGAN